MAVSTLSPSQLDEHRKRLLAMRADLGAAARSRLSGTDEPGSVSVQAHLGQPDDMSVADELADDALVLLDHERTQLADIDTALARVELGLANVCIICGRDIPFERLRANPLAQTDVNCQERIEKGEHLPPGATM